MANPTFVQVNNTDPNTSSTSRTCLFTGAQTAGNANVIHIFAGGSSLTINTPTDTKGNTYVLLKNSNLAAPINRLWTYVATNIAVATANSNTVTVTSSAGAVVQWGVIILEYGNVATASIADGTATSGTGTTGTTATSASLTTTNAADMLVSCCFCVSQAPSGAGSGYTSRVITTAAAFMAQDRLVTSTGTYTATAPLTASSDWNITIAALKGSTSAAARPGAVAATAVTSVTTVKKVFNLTTADATIAVSAVATVKKVQAITTADGASIASAAVTIRTVQRTIATASAIASATVVGRDAFTLVDGVIALTASATFRSVYALTTADAIALSSAQIFGRVAFSTVDASILSSASIAFHQIRRFNPLALGTANAATSTHLLARATPSAHIDSHAAITSSVNRIVVAASSSVLAVVSIGGVGQPLFPFIFNSFRRAPVSEAYLGTVTSNQVVDCTGCFAISILLRCATLFSPVLTLTNLNTGVPVTVQFWNNHSATNHLILDVRTPDAISYRLNPGEALDTVGLSVPANSAVELFGLSFAPGLLFSHS
jgi:hypothetical protein